MMRSNSGFTLLEILIATAIAAVVLASSSLILGKSHNTVAYIEKKAAADLAAKNIMDRHRMDLIPSKKAELKNETGNTTMGGFDFSYVQTLTPAALPGLNKVDVVINDKDGNKLRTLTTFLMKE